MDCQTSFQNVVQITQEFILPIIVASTDVASSAYLEDPQHNGAYSFGCHSWGQLDSRLFLPWKQPRQPLESPRPASEEMPGLWRS